MASLHVHPKVADALRRGTPVVALESAVITTGLPRTPLGGPPHGADTYWKNDEPLNLEAARLMRRLVSSAGAVPAVIALFDGDLHIGVDDDELVALAANEEAGKIASSTLAHAMVMKQTAGTTVSATLAACMMPPALGDDLSPIRFFATGGIGGVHRGWTDRPDISTDLRLLAASPVCVVSAGAKSLLDLPATVEAFETLGVPLVGFRTDSFPAFYTRGDSSLLIPTRLDEPEQVAELCRLHWNHRAIRTGVLVANPIPEEAALDRTIDSAALDAHIAAAEEQATRAGVTGAARTPFVLSVLAERTDGEALHANVALLAANATLAAQVAVSWSRSGT